MLIKLETGEKTKHFLTALYCFFFSKVRPFFPLFCGGFHVANKLGQFR